MERGERATPHLKICLEEKLSSLEVASPGLTLKQYIIWSTCGMEQGKQNQSNTSNIFFLKKKSAGLLVGKHSRKKSHRLT